jgi:hypothetical protein
MKDGKQQLVLYTEDNPDGLLATEHIVYIEPGTKVVWRRAKDSGIKRLGRIGPKTDEYEIFPGDATTFLLHKRYRIKANENIVVPNGEDDFLEDAYDINFVVKENGEEIKADPYLRIED